MKLRVAVCVLAATGVVLTGCTEGEVAAKSSPSAAKSTTLPPGKGVTRAPVDQIYLDTAWERFPNYGISYLMQERQNLCDRLSLNPTTDGWVAEVKRLTDQNLSGGDAGYLIGTQVMTGCPELQSALPNPGTS